MNYKFILVLLILITSIFLGCAERKETNTEKVTEGYKEIIGFMTYINRLEPDGQRTIVLVVSPTATKNQVIDLVDFLITDNKENKMWIEIWDSAETLQKGSGITDADKMAHYIVNVRVDKAIAQKEYYWEK